MSIQVVSSLDLHQAEQRVLLRLMAHAHHTDGHAIGFIPLCGLERGHHAGQVIACKNNDEIVGYSMFGWNDRQLRIYQMWVRPDARLILHGRAMSDLLCSHAASCRRSAVALWCAEDLPANLFWSACGFRYINWRHGQNRSGRRHYQWWRPTRRSSLITH